MAAAFPTVLLNGDVDDGHGLDGDVHVSGLHIEHKLVA